MILFDASHTSHTRAQTGVQRVVRSMFAALNHRESIEPVCFDPHQAAWRSLQVWEKQNLADNTGAGSAHRSATWPLGVRLAAYASKLFNTRTRCPEGKALIVPEIFSAKVARSYPALFKNVRGPRVAVFHDAVALKLPEFTPPKTVGRFPAYLHELLAFDGIAAVSEDSRQSLVDFWRWSGVKNPPPVITITNAIGTKQQLAALREIATRPSPASPLPTILCVGSLEGRKNHEALLDACERLWSEKLTFELRLIGLAHPQTGRTALERISALRAAGRPLHYDGPVDNAALRAAYAACAFTVYPSLSEGFGLPVQESLAHGKPCICSARGAIGESAADGGCLTLDHTDAETLARALRLWLTQPQLVATATNEALTRQFKTWEAQADELVLWLRDLSTRDQKDRGYAGNGSPLKFPLSFPGVYS